MGSALAFAPTIALSRQQIDRRLFGLSRIADKARLRVDTHRYIPNECYDRLNHRQNRQYACIRACAIPTPLTMVKLELPMPMADQTMAQANWHPSRAHYGGEGLANQTGEVAHSRNKSERVVVIDVPVCELPP